MADLNNMWINLPKYTPEYVNGVKAFVHNAFANFSVGNELRCPCKKCNNRRWHAPSDVNDHLICNGPSPNFVQWIYDVSDSNSKGNDSEDYCPENDSAVGNDEDEANVAPVTSKRIKQQIVRKKDGTRPVTRFRINIEAAATEMVTTHSQVNLDAVAVDEATTLDKDAGGHVTMSGTKKSKRSNKENAGSMTAYLAMRQRQKLEQQQLEPEKLSKVETGTTMPEIVEHFSAGNESEDKKNSRRGQTKMDYFHTRKIDERKEIKLNEHFQPIHENTDVLTEYSSFLGTMGRNVSLTYVSWHSVPNKDKLWEYVKQKYIIPEEGKEWALRTMNDAWRMNKSHIKRNHYKPYDNDEERKRNRPRNIPLEVFNVLLEYWNDENVKKIAKQNAAARSCIKETHTAGRICFAQNNNKLKVGNPNHESPTRADVFVETRKRKEGHEYKESPDVLNFRVSKIKEMKSSGGNIDLVEPLILGDGVHASAKKVKKNSKQCDPNHFEDYINDLTIKICKQLAAEMEDKVNQKVQEKMAMILNKLGEVNPILKINFAEVLACPSGSSCNKRIESSMD